MSMDVNAFRDQLLSMSAGIERLNALRGVLADMSPLDADRFVSDLYDGAKLEKGMSEFRFGEETGSMVEVPTYTDPITGMKVSEGMVSSTAGFDRPGENAPYGEYTAQWNPDGSLKGTEWSQSEREGSWLDEHQDVVDGIVFAATTAGIATAAMGATGVGAAAAGGAAEGAGVAAGGAGMDVAGFEGLAAADMGGGGLIESAAGGAAMDTAGYEGLSAVDAGYGGTGSADFVGSDWAAGQASGSTGGMLPSSGGSTLANTGSMGLGTGAANSAGGASPSWWQTYKEFAPLVNPLIGGLLQGGGAYLSQREKREMDDEARQRAYDNWRVGNLRLLR